MASTTLIVLLPILLLLNPQAQAQAQAPAPAPTGGLNLTAILEKGSQYNTLIKLLTDTQQLTQIQSQLKSNSQGFTVFAPTDNAFQNLPSGALNGLTDDKKVQLILYHVTPKYYSLSDLLTVSNPVRTQAPWGLNFTGQGNQVNVSSGAVQTPINNALRQQFPLAVFQVDKVLWPLAFTADANSPSPAPAPKKGSKGGAETATGGAADASPSPSGASKDDSNGVAGKNVGFGIVLGFVFICMSVFS